MPQSIDIASYRIKMDGTWRFDDLYGFSRVYSQLYAFQYSFEQQTVSEDTFWWFSDPYVAHPWVGGYDAVNFYKQLEKRVPPRHRPTLLRMHYASPGWMDLGLSLVVAECIRKVVHRYIDTASALNRLYNEIQKGVQERKLMKISVKRSELRLNRDRMQFIEDCSEKLSGHLEFEHKQELDVLTGNALTTLKILQSHFRRIKKLSEYETSGKTEI